MRILPVDLSKYTTADSTAICRDSRNKSRKSARSDLFNVWYLTCGGFLPDSNADPISDYLFISRETFDAFLCRETHQRFRVHPCGSGLIFFFYLGKGSKLAVSSFPSLRIFSPIIKGLRIIHWGIRNQRFEGRIFYERDVNPFWARSGTSKKLVIKVIMMNAKSQAFSIEQEQEEAKGVIVMPKKRKF